ncbi:MAG: hypothetical protein K5898_12290 [Ruminococcus sp.]|uniref:hypothetical protein n=1 Tax=Ruminococcus sp. TaxID=41978 RepID=UPI0025F3BDFD|nr:hypothetical protein [Ruminococcus sp.]MCR4795919.1 hypothetical protein [Ruminococcus sp.]
MLYLICLSGFGEWLSEAVEDYGLIALAAIPSLVLIGFLLRCYIKLLINDPKGALSALFLVLGVIAALTIPAFFIDPKIWGDIVMLAIISIPVVYFAVKQPKRMVKIVLLTISCAALLTAIGFIFSPAIAIAAAFNGFMLAMTISSFFSLKKCIKLEKEGLRTEGRFLRWQIYGRNSQAIFGYTTEDGVYHEESVCDFAAASRKMKKQPLTLLYDREDTSTVYVQKYSLIGCISYFCIFLALLAGMLIFTIYLLILSR